MFVVRRVSSHLDLPIGVGVQENLLASQVGAELAKQFHAGYSQGSAHGFADRGPKLAQTVAQLVRDLEQQASEIVEEF